MSIEARPSKLLHSSGVLCILRRGWITHPAENCPNFSTLKWNKVWIIQVASVLRFQW